MRSRTASESVRTSIPSTRALPPLSGNKPVSILMTVVFPLPFGPRKPKISPFSTRKLTSLTAVKLPKRRTRRSAEIAGSDKICVGVAIVSTCRLEFHVRGHACEHTAGGIIDADFDAENLVHAFLAGLHVAGKEFRLLVDLLDFAVENGARKGVDTNLRFLPEPDPSKFGFRDIDADVDLILLEKRGDRCVGRDQIAWANV